MATWLEEFESSDSDWSDASNEASGIDPGSITDSPAMEEDPLTYFINDLGESISLTGETSSGGDYTVSTGGYQLSNGTTSTPGISQTNSVVSTLGIAPGAKPDKTWTDGFREFIRTNQSDLLKLGFAAVQGMAAESSKQKTAASAAQSQIDQITLKDKLEQDKTKRIGDSIKGLAPVKKWGGNLKRTDGSSVFQPTGLINMGGKV